MIRGMHLSSEGTMKILSHQSEIADWFKLKEGVLWLDLANEQKEDCRAILLDVFNFHPLAVDDALEETHVPKVDDWGAYLYLVLYAIQIIGADEDYLNTAELDIFLGEKYLVTYHDKPIAPLDALWEHCQRDDRYLQRGVAYLLYHLSDDLVADYMPVFDTFDEMIDQIEDQVLNNPRRETLEHIFTLKRALLRLRRLMLPMREVFNKLSRDGYVNISSEQGFFFRDVYDHLVRLHDITESLRDLVGGALDIYLSAINNRMNEIMKTLTIITTLFMPLSFLTGFFGMNFFQPVLPLQDWTGRLAFGLTVGTVFFVPFVMYLWMHGRKWM